MNSYHNSSKSNKFLLFTSCLLIYYLKATRDHFASPVPVHYSILVSDKIDSNHWFTLGAIFIIPYIIISEHRDGLSENANFIFMLKE